VYLYATYGSQDKEQTFPYTKLTDWILWSRWRVFTARYALNPYTKQIRFVFKGLKYRANDSAMLVSHKMSEEGVLL